MAFDWKSFAAAFMDDQAKQIQKRREEASDYKKKQEEEFERNKLAYDKRRQFVTTAMSQVNMLRAYGADDKQIKAAVAAGPETLFTFAEQLSQESAKSGKKTFSRSEIDAMINMPESFDGGGMSVDEFLKRSYGLVEPSVGSIEAPKRSFWEKALGVNLEQEVRAGLDKEARYQGYSVMDINELARQEAYTSLVPGAYFTFTPGVEYDPVTIASRWQSLRESAVADAQDSPAYKQAQMKGDEAAMRRITQQAVEPLAAAFADKYGQKWIDDPIMGVKRYLGEEGYTSLSVQYGNPENIAAELRKGLSVETDTTEEIRAGDFKFTFDVSGGVVSGSVKGTPIPDALLEQALEEAMNKGYIATRTMPPATPATERPVPMQEALNIPPSLVPSMAEVEGLTQPEAPTVETPKVEAPEVTAEMPAPMDIQSLRDAMQNVSEAEWKQMSRQDREEKGLPISPIEVIAAGSDAFFDPTLQTLNDSPEVLTFFTENSNAMASYLMDKGITEFSKDEEIKGAVDEYIKANDGVGVTADKLVGAAKTMLAAEQGAIKTDEDAKIVEDFYSKERDSYYLGESNKTFSRIAASGMVNRWRKFAEERGANPELIAYIEKKINQLYGK